MILYGIYVREFTQVITIETEQNQAQIKGKAYVVAMKLF